MEAKFYYPIFLFIVTVFTLGIYPKYSARKALVTNAPYSLSKSWASNVPCFILALFMILFIGLRPVSGSYFGDMANYVQGYYRFYEGVPFSFDLDVENVIWDNWWALWGSLRLGTETFFVLSAGIYFIGTYIFCKKVFPTDTLLAYLFFLAAFSTFSYTTNGCKAGNAATVFLLAIAYRDNWLISVPILLISLGFHHSMKLPIVAFLAVSIYKNPKIYFYVWILCVLMSLAHVTFFQVLFAQISTDSGDEQGAGYLMGSDTNGWGGRSGFRYDFVLYSAMPVLVGYFALFVKRIESKDYNFILNLYLLLNSVWMLCMYAEFTNRIAYLSWFMYPFVLIYPFLKEDWGKAKYKTLSKIMLCHLGFTLFMQLIYY